MRVLDERFLAITAIISLVWQISFFVIAAGCKFDKVTDLAYGSNFVVLAVVTLCANNAFYPRQIVVSIAVILYGIRLATFLFVRILIIGKDHRFDSTRDSPVKFFIWFIFQFMVVWLVSLPYILVNAVSTNIPLQVNDYVGWAIWFIGCLCEAIADHQKFLYRSNPENVNHWCDVGLWHFSRHPNYFGEILCWWGIFITATSVLKTWDWLVIVSPILMTVVLLFGSGVPTTERASDSRFLSNPDYILYKARTPILVPFIPGVFGGFAKVLFCCEYPCYSFRGGRTTLITLPT